MCGIGGKLSFETRPEPNLGRAMIGHLSHRGPDADGVYANGPAMLAHTRLSILDPSAAGRQPMSNADGTVHIVFNGEIYNYRELRDQLTDYTFQSETDTEVLLHLYEEERFDCLDSLRGMFAFAIWDETEQQLFMARDRTGQKPLFFRRTDDTFWFGSTIKTILADPAVAPEPKLHDIRSYLTYQYVPGPGTGFNGIKQLRPAEYAVIDSDGMRRERYWSLSFGDQSDASPERLAARLREELREATRLRMRSDVPVGVFLSGGVDSSIITALMDDLSPNPVNTYSVGFTDNEYDERRFAREVADAYGTNHHEYTVEPDAMTVFPELVEQFEMPFGDPSALPTYYVSQAATQDTTVVLGGDAGDENFAGYDRYTYDWLTKTTSSVPARALSAALSTLSAVESVVGRRSQLADAKRLLGAANGGEVEQYAEYICHTFGTDLAELWTGPMPDDDLRYLRVALEETDGPTRMDRLLQADINTYLPDDLLTKVDRASMAHSLEVRAPFLDHKLMEFAARIPAKYKWRYGKKKWLLKRAFSNLLPDRVLTREKQGFGVPLDDWFRHELRDFGRQHTTSLAARDPFDATRIDRIFSDHLAGDADNGRLLWDFAMLNGWYERFIDD